MQYNINLKNVKQSISTLSSFLKEKGYSIPHNIVLEAFSKSLFFKNWNTLEGITQKPKVIDYIDSTYQYLIEITVDMDKKQLITLFQESLDEAHTKAKIEYVLHDKNDFHIHLNIPQNGDNTLTAFMLFGNKLKSQNKIPTRMENCRIHIEKESWIEFFK